jgi:hypothetical protein
MLRSQPLLQIHVKFTGNRTNLICRQWRARLLKLDTEEGRFGDLASSAPRVDTVYGGTASVRRRFPMVETGKTMVKRTGVKH